MPNCNSSLSLGEVTLTSNPVLISKSFEINLSVCILLADIDPREWSSDVIGGLLPRPSVMITHSPLLSNTHPVHNIKDPSAPNIETWRLKTPKKVLSPLFVPNVFFLLWHPSEGVFRSLVLDCCVRAEVAIMELSLLCSSNRYLLTQTLHWLHRCLSAALLGNFNF